jgi:hypothetical protein
MHSIDVVQWPLSIDIPLHARSKFGSITSPHQRCKRVLSILKFSFKLRDLLLLLDNDVSLLVLLGHDFFFEIHNMCHHITQLVCHVGHGLINVIDEHLWVVEGYLITRLQSFLVF